MREVAPGIWHWSAEHPRIRKVVHSYYLPEERVLIDPIAPEVDLDWFVTHGPPAYVLLTNRHHYRSSGAFVERFGVTVRCVRQGIHEFDDGRVVEPFEFGEELPGGIVAHEVGAICPDESALHIPARQALAVADGVVRWNPDDDLGFVADALMDDPEETKEALRDSYRRLLDLEFEHLLLAHGRPCIGDGRAALADFVT